MTPPDPWSASRTSRPSTAALLVVSVLASISAIGGQAEPPAGSARAEESRPLTLGSFDLATVEELGLFFAVESVRRLRIPLLLRLLPLGHDEPSKQERIDAILDDPPRADAQGVVYPLGDKNPLSLVYNAEARTLSCWERLVKLYGSTTAFGPTGPEMAAALNAASSRDRDRGGADFAYDPIRDAISLRRDYLHPPTDRNRFHKELSRLLRTELKWEKGLYLERATAIAESRRPPSSATATTDGFGATLVLRHFSAEPAAARHWVERYVRAWDHPPGGLEPRLVSDRELRVDQLLHAFIHFRGARDDAWGAAAVEATFRLLAPDGSEQFADLELPIWEGKAPPADHLQLGVNDISFSIDREEPTGTYQLEAEVCDVVTSRCVTLAHRFVLRL
jgi:hypothetical protein